MSTNLLRATGLLGLACSWTSPAGAAPGDLPLLFLENGGQWEGETAFLARRGELTLAVLPDGVDLHLKRAEILEPVRLRFEGAGAARLVGEEPAAVRSAFFVGSDPTRWREGLRSYERVLYEELYPGVDLRLAELEGWPKYDVLVAPHARLEQVVVRCEGVERLELAPDGALVLHTPAGELRQPAPVTWQVLESGERERLECAYVLMEGQRYGFSAPGRDEALALVVDPGIEWAQLYGGSANDAILASAFQGAELVVCGLTESPDLPGAPPSGGVGRAGFVARFDAVGALIDAVYLDGAANDGAYELGVDAAGLVYVTGYTSSLDFPVTGDALQPALGGGTDGFLVVLDFDPSAPSLLRYSSYFGGSGIDWCGALEVDAASGEVSIGGVSHSSNLPTTAGAYQPSLAGLNDFFVARLDPQRSGASQVLWCTYVGGAGYEFQPGWAPPDLNSILVDLALSPAGAVAFGSQAISGGFPLVNPFQGDQPGHDGIVFLLDPSASGPAQLVWSTYFGGGLVDGVSRLVVEPSGAVALVGWTHSTDLPLSSEPLVPSAGASQDGWLARLDPSASGASQLLYGSYLATSGYDLASDLAEMAPGVLAVCGFVDGPELPTTPDAVSPSPIGGPDAFLLQVDTTVPAAEQLRYGTYLGGGAAEIAHALCVSPLGRLLVAGETDSLDFPSTTGPAPAGGWDAFLLQLCILGAEAYCSGDGSASPCPCGNTNDGSLGGGQAGCANGSSAGGARLSGTGSASVAADDLVLVIEGAVPNQPGLVFQGDTAVAGGAGALFGDGLRCAGGNVRRLEVLVPDAMGGAQTSVSVVTRGQPQPGDVKRYQLWYRDPSGSVCGAGFNLSNGLAIPWFQ